MPLTADFNASFQWTRELETRQNGKIVAVQFRIPDDELVLFGHYHHRHDAMKSAEAVGLFMKLPDARGYEVIIPAVSRQTHSIRPVPQTTGLAILSRIKRERSRNYKTQKAAAPLRFAGHLRRRIPVFRPEELAELISGKVWRIVIVGSGEERIMDPIRFERLLRR